MIFGAALKTYMSVSATRWDDGDLTALPKSAHSGNSAEWIQILEFLSIFQVVLVGDHHLTALSSILWSGLWGLMLKSCQIPWQSSIWSRTGLLTTSFIKVMIPSAN